MRRLGMMIWLVMAMILTGCEDNPEIIFHDYSGCYTLSGDMRLDLTVNGLKVTDTKSGVVFSWHDGEIAQITLVAIVDGEHEMTVGGLAVTELPDGKGIQFYGEFPVSQTEKMVIKGTIIDLVMTLEVDTVPINATT